MTNIGSNWHQNKNRKAWNLLSPRSQRDKKHQALKYLHYTGVPCHVIHSPSHTSPSHTLAYHPSRSCRNKIRKSLKGMIQSERKCIRHKLHLAATSDTETAYVINNNIIYVYLTDPIKFIQTNIIQPYQGENKDRYMIIGGDKGGDTTKLGITYPHPCGVNKFACLVAYTGKDDYDGMNQLMNSDIKFKGESAKYEHIFEVFNNLSKHCDGLYREKIYINGDWNFINGILGLKAPGSSIHPCFICNVQMNKTRNNIVITNNNHITFEYRSMDELIHHGYDHYHRFDSQCYDGVINIPLLQYPLQYIIPLPLHVLLGLVNNFIQAMKKICIKHHHGAEYDDIIASIKTTSVTIGASGFHTLNGNEIKNLLTIKYACKQQIIDLLEEKSEEYKIDHDRIDTMFEWSNVLYDYLLSHKHNDTVRATFFKQYILNTIWPKWYEVTQRKQTPKCHLLYHTAEFIQQLGTIGKYSESTLESFHYTYNEWLSKHKNCGKRQAEKMRRALADAVLHCVKNNCK